MRNWDPLYAVSGRRMIPPDDTGLRASDAERNQVADKLSRHFAEGRLDSAEFKDRLDHAMGATTRGDLRGLFDDLPPLEDEPAPAPSRRRRMIPFLVLVALVAVAAGSALSYPYGRLPWLLIVVVVFFVWHRSGEFHHHHGHRSSVGSSGNQIIG
ncbi:MAG: DUF1707 domain-containing protein [Acidimicrobiales bacterium]